METFLWLALDQSIKSVCESEYMSLPVCMMDKKKKHTSPEHHQTLQNQPSKVHLNLFNVERKRVVLRYIGNSVKKEGNMLFCTGNLLDKARQRNRLINVSL